MNKQTLTQKKGEVRFRQKIVEQHTGRVRHFPEEYSREEMLEELAKRREAALADFTRLRRKQILFSPFLEIGAEYGIRSLVLSNQFGASGASLDISQASLASMQYLAKELDFVKLPTKICADAEILPFTDNTFAFVFCYQTLHHFPNPQLVIDEVFRVLAPGGFFFFAEEPIKQEFNLDLFRRPTKTRGFFRLLKIIPLLPFVSTPGKTETDHGVLEATYPLRFWLSLLKKFMGIEITIESLWGKQSYIYQPPAPLVLSLGLKLQLWFFGGGIKALARKPLANSQLTFQLETQPHQIQLKCPACHHPLGSLGRTKRFHCKCKSHYNHVNGILTLLPKSLRKKLYGQY